MIHIGTLHYRDERWIDLQRRYLDRHTSEPYRLCASLDRIPPERRSSFELAVDHTDVATALPQGERIDRKLDLLTERILRDADGSDLLVIMHGDTLPIADWVPALRPRLEESGLAAVRRDENIEPLPHWSFCVTTAGFWTELGSDWGRGPTFDSLGRPTTDTGANLWRDLGRAGVDWHPLLRTGAVAAHPLWFGVYGGIVYHHGAGFRVQMSRLDASRYSHLPVPLRNVVGVSRRIVNTFDSRRIYRRLKSGEDFPLKIREPSPG